MRQLAHDFRCSRKRKYFYRKGSCLANNQDLTLASSLTPPALKASPAFEAAPVNLGKRGANPTARIFLAVRSCPCVLFQGSRRLAFYCRR